MVNTQELLEDLQDAHSVERSLYMKQINKNIAVCITAAKDDVDGKPLVHAFGGDWIKVRQGDMFYIA